MKPQPRYHDYLYVAAMLLAVTAIGWSLWLLSETPAFLRQAGRRQQLIVQLEALEKENAVLDALIRPFAETPAAEDLRRHLEEIFNNTDPERMGMDTVLIAERFSLHTVTVDEAHILYASLVERIREAEALRPPLKLAACLLEPAPGKSAEGRAVLTFERIEWNQENHFLP